MNCKILYIFCLFLSLASCHSGKRQNSRELLEYDSLSVSIDFPYLPNYPSWTSVYHQDTLYVAGYNRFMHSIDLLNLSGGNHRTIKLENEGPNGVSSATRFCFCKGRLIVIEHKRIVEMDLEGKVINIFSAEDLTRPDEGILYRPLPFGIQISGHTRFEAYQDEVFIPLTTSLIKPTTCIGAKLDIMDARLDLLPVYYPEGIYRQKGVSGNMIFPQIVPLQDRLIYSFPCSSQVYVYDRTTGQITNFKMNSLLVEDEIALPTNVEELQLPEFEMSTARYREVNYSPNSHKYYRFVWGERRKTDDIRPLYLNVLNELTKECHEYELPTFFSEKEYIVHDDILYVAFKNNTDEAICFAKIDIAKL